MIVKAKDYFKLEVERDTYKELSETYSKVIDKLCEKIERMKRCENCEWNTEDGCIEHTCDGMDKWELAE